jgi:hypothetical protein
MEDQILDTSGIELYKFGGGLAVGFAQGYISGKMEQTKQEYAHAQLEGLSEKTNATDPMIVKHGRAIGMEDDSIEQYIDGEVVNYDNFDDIDREVWEEHDGFLEEAFLDRDELWEHLDSAYQGTVLSLFYDLAEDLDGSDDFVGVEDYGTAVAGYVTGRTLGRSMTDRDPAEIS